MADYPNLPARYSKGTLKLRRPLRLPEGTEVRVTIQVAGSEEKGRKTTRRKYRYPSRPLPRHTLRAITGIASLGGDALADSEALYDHD
jgi:predicted DNA-binding antitoxin AbrB/MazE fold protein